MTPEEKAWTFDVAKEAAIAQHVFPEMAACEAALESTYGQSKLAREAKNLFGLKEHKHNIYGEELLPTREFLNSEWVVVNAEWEKYDTFSQCFLDRMETLQRLSEFYPHYKEALLAKSPEDYIFAVSKTWSTDPERAHKVLAIYSQVFVTP